MSGTHAVKKKNRKKKAESWTRLKRNIFWKTGASRTRLCLVNVTLQSLWDTRQEWNATSDLSETPVEVELCVFKLNVLADSSFDETSSSLIIARTSGAVLLSRAVSCFYNRRTPERKRAAERFVQTASTIRVQTKTDDMNQFLVNFTFRLMCRRTKGGFSSCSSKISANLMEYLTDPWDIFHNSIWENAHTRPLERHGHLVIGQTFCRLMGQPEFFTPQDAQLRS